MKIFRIPIRIQPLFWILSGLIGFISTYDLLLTIIWMVVILVSVLVHEYGHALTARVFGQHAIISLTGFGGLTQRSGKKLKLWQELLIVFNGPLAGFLLFLASSALLEIFHDKPQVIGSLTIYVLTVTTIINLFWTIFNLFPVQPLDGGKLVSILLESVFGFRGTKIAMIFSIVVGGVLGLFLFSMGLILPGSLFLIFTFENYRLWKASKEMTEQDQDVALWHQLKIADTAFQAGRLEEAASKLQELRAKTGQGMIYVTATELLSDVFTRQDRFEEAYHLLISVKEKLTPDYFSTFQYLAYVNKDYKTAIDYGNRSYQENPNSQVALINAFCHSLIGEVRPAVGWLDCAYKEGLDNLHEAIQRADFDPIRGDPLFIDLTKNINK